jgi:hypothetical protein
MAELIEVNSVALEEPVLDAQAIAMRHITKQIAQFESKNGIEERREVKGNETRVSSVYAESIFIESNCTKEIILRFLKDAEKAYPVFKFSCSNYKMTMEHQPFKADIDSLLLVNSLQIGKMWERLFNTRLIPVIFIKKDKEFKLAVSQGMFRIPNNIVIVTKKLFHELLSNFKIYRLFCQETKHDFITNAKFVYEWGPRSISNRLKCFMPLIRPDIIIQQGRCRDYNMGVFVQCPLCFESESPDMLFRKIRKCEHYICSQCCDCIVKLEESRELDDPETQPKCPLCRIEVLWSESVYLHISNMSIPNLETPTPMIFASNDVYNTISRRPSYTGCLRDKCPLLFLDLDWRVRYKDMVPGLHLDDSEIVVFYHEAMHLDFLEKFCWKKMKLHTVTENESLTEEMFFDHFDRTFKK